MRITSNRCVYYLKVLLNNGSYFNDIQECDSFKVENGMVIFMDINKDRMYVVTAMYPAANLIIERIREIKE